MNPVLHIILTVLFWLAVSGIFMLILSWLIISYIIYTMHLKRRGRHRWTRECSSDDPRQHIMYDEGVQWSEKHKDKKQDLHIVNDGLNLYGEYYDMGYDRTVIMLSGRTEGLRYCYYFAQPYSDSGFNVLTIDQRAHGESDGEFNTVGFEEHKDALAWAEYLHTNFGVKKIIMHGICIGGSTGLFAQVSEDCPDYIDGLVVEGMHPNFCESFKNHMIELDKSVNPVIHFVDMWMRLFTGHSMKYGPINCIDKMKKPLLMLHSREDKYSTPEYAQLLFDKCNSDRKRIVYFDRGDHSMIRIVDKEKYDNAIKEFINDFYC